MKRTSPSTFKAKASGRAQAKRKATTERSILGRKQFAKISEVEGIRLSDEMKQTMAKFDKEGLSPEERRRAIIGRFRRAAGK